METDAVEVPVRAKRERKQPQFFKPAEDLGRRRSSGTVEVQDYLSGLQDQGGVHDSSREVNTNPVVARVALCASRTLELQHLMLAWMSVRKYFCKPIVWVTCSRLILMRIASCPCGHTSWFLVSKLSSVFGSRR